ncbi:MAG: glycosyltransferase family 87 protein [Albidovulum sp.]
MSVQSIYSTPIDPARDRWLAALFVAIWALVTSFQQWGHWPEDLSAIYVAGWLWNTGQFDLIYDFPSGFFGGAAESWEPVIAGLGIGADEPVFPYVYPPIWAVLFSQITAIAGPRSFANAVTVIHILMLAASVLLAGRIMRPSGMPRWVWAAIGTVILSISIQAYLAIWHSQPTITVTFLTLLAFERMLAGRGGTAGAVLALAAAIKLIPAAFALLFLLDRQYRALFVFMLVGGALGLLSILLAGWPLHAQFLHSLGAVSDTGYLIAINISLKPALLAVGSVLGFLPMPDPDLSQIVYTRSVPVWLAPSLLVAALGLIIAFSRLLSRQGSARLYGLGAIVLSVIVALFGPLGWHHYYVLPMLLLPGLLTDRAARYVLAVIFLSSLTPVFGYIGILPWPIAVYTWWMCAAWLALLVVVYRLARSSQ